MRSMASGHALCRYSARWFLSGAECLARTVVLLADLSPMLEDMVSTVLKDRSDIEVIRGANHDHRLIDIAIAAGAPLVVTSSHDPSNLASVDPYLANATRVSIVALALDGASAFFHTFTLSKKNLEEVSAEQILAKVKAAARKRDDCLTGDSDR